MSPYRYQLERSWLTGRGRATFVMLNPSTADEIANDATIRKCIGFAERWGRESIEVVNLWPIRATDPGDMLAAADPWGDKVQQMEAMVGAIHRAETLVFAWGSHRDRADRKGLRPTWEPAKIAERMGKTPMCLGTTKSGQPRHPLMLAYATELVEF